MKKIIIFFAFLLFSQHSFGQIAQYSTLYLLFEPDSTQTNSVQDKGDMYQTNPNGTLRNENGYCFMAKHDPEFVFEIQNFYPFCFVSFDKTQAIIISMSSLNNYPVKTIDQVRAEANPSNTWFFKNHAFFDPIQHYYIVEKNTPAIGQATITKVEVRWTVPD